MATVIDAGGRPFEVIVGAPSRRYGARITFAPEHSSNEEEDAAARIRLARALGVEDHPWGAPSWVGARVDERGLLDVKAYHRVTNGRVGSERIHLPSDLPATPVMAASKGGEVEAYFAWKIEESWGSFVRACASLFGVDARDVAFRPRPRPTAGGFGLSVRRRGDAIVAVTMFASARALPPDDVVAREWCIGLDPSDARAHERAFAAVRSVGRAAPRSHHAMLSWTFEASGQRHRAASLFVPLPSSMKLARASGPRSHPWG